ncbi:mannonate dehydratase [Bradyrhizobium sp. 521_C7_N1_3]|uniref:mannonate dehydratase n=1 Tax=Bradyrhizobium sp. 521_C7_N1_3 TaxID=3240368 RepID=UPI003F8BED8B
MSDRPLNNTDYWQPKRAEPRYGLELPAKDLRWLSQLGVGVLWGIATATGEAAKVDKGYLTTEQLLHVKEICEDAGVKLEGMSLPSRSLSLLGKPGRDLEIENTCRTIRSMGEAGVPVAWWTFFADIFWDHRVGYYESLGRGGMSEHAFDFERVRNEQPFPEIGIVSEKEIWDRLTYFAKPVIEAAEKAGVRMALHPSDPPVPVMRGVARPFTTPADYLRFFKEIPSEANGMDLCIGVFTEMAGVDPIAEIHRFGRMGKIHMASFRSVKGKVPRYTEVLLGEGDVNMIQAMKALKEVGFNGLLMAEHAPALEGDNPTTTGGTVDGHVGFSYEAGYIAAAVQAVNTLS